MQRKRHAIHSDRIYVVRVNRRRQWVARLLALLCLVGLPVAVYQATMQYAAVEMRQLENTHGQLLGISQQVEAERDQLRQQMANLEMTAELDRQAINQLREQLVVWRERGEEQSAQIQFYLSLMDPASGANGVFLDRAEIAATPEPGRFRYQVVVGQKSQNHDRVTGSLQIVVHNGDMKPVQSYHLGELSDQATPLPLGFKFFQILEGFIYLPSDFEPAVWSLEFDIRTPVRQVFREDLDWQVQL